MATQAVRAKQRAIAVNRLTEAANAAAASLGIEPVEIPLHHRDAAHLPTVQIEAITALLERITEGAAPAKTDDDAKDDDAAKPAKAATDTTRRATSAAKATKGR